MMPKELLDPDMSDALDALRRSEEPFAIATIVRTAGATAAKPGAKALLRADGTIMHGWLGGGCTRGAVRKAAVSAIEDGAPKLISVAPEDVLSENGRKAGDQVDGVEFARNGCPSKGSIDVFIEPCLPRPELLVYGASPVALALTALAERFDWEVAAISADEPLDQCMPGRLRAIVVATQGQGDLKALTNALEHSADYVAFVGSRKKYAALALKLEAEYVPADRISTVDAPAGMDIGAVTPEEIALSILADLTRIRRRVANRASAVS